MTKPNLLLEQLDYLNGDIAYYEREIDRLQADLDKSLARRQKVEAVINSALKDREKRLDARIDLAIAKFTVTPEGHFRLTGVLPTIETVTSQFGDYHYMQTGEWSFDEEEALEGALAYLALYNHLSNIRTSPVKLDNE